MQDDTNHHGCRRLALGAVLGCLVAGVLGSCALEDEDGFDDLELRGVTHTTHEGDGDTHETSTTTYGTSTTTHGMSTTTTTTTTGGGGGCETAFAYGGDDAMCFIDMEEAQGNNWGWTAPVNGDEVWPVYAGAGQCDLDNGVLVGYLSLVREGDTLTIDFDPLCGFVATEVHIYVGEAPLPEGNNGPTTAPGKYPLKDENPDGSPYVFEGVEDGDYVIFHAEVCGEPC
jgi:hypothetical protein